LMIMKQILRYSGIALLALVVSTGCNDGNNMSKEDTNIQQDSLDTRRNTTGGANTIPDTATMKTDTMGTDTTQRQGPQQ
jgi:hypothetical protein